MLTLVYPVIDPVAIAIGPIAIRWYALAYIAGIVLGWRYMLHLCRAHATPVTAKDIDDLVVWATLGIVLGGRLGYVLFYKPGYFVENPAEILQLWKGGMAFHGGLIGVFVAFIAIARRRDLPWRAVGDLVAAATPIGLLLGRIANFINAELYGRTTDVPWAMVFPGGGPLPRHPSQLYEAALEGLILFLVIHYAIKRKDALDRHGLVGGLFLAGYAIARIAVEFFREPDAHLGFLVAGTTMGQLLSLPLLALGVWLVATARKKA
ncbi:MAG: prolipoprotein diacylglyceryl transferase [Alphaproteobacteria bacterium]|nr:prolipoprotein diacylglyceryl transferase [Alphaproteobacteria bacterium]